MHALRITNLEKTYRDGTRALDGVSLEVSEGAFFGLLGPNGAGKTTLIRIVAGLVTCTAGEIEVFGINPITQPSQAKRLIGLVPQEFNFNIFERVFDIVVQQAGYYGIPREAAIPRTEEYLDRLGLWEKRFTQARALSGGMKRRLLIARSLVHQPKLLFLDEPTAGVDVELRRDMWDFVEQINDGGTTVILTTHYLEEAEQLCENIAIINQGSIIENTTKRELISRHHSQAFVLDLMEPLQETLHLESCQARVIDPLSLEVVLETGTNLTTVFLELARKGIAVTSMRNRANRLEELFLEMINTP
ncbi:MAG: ABC transporter ATP-binding protein [Gemmataceae bacterium]